MALFRNKCENKEYLKIKEFFELLDNEDKYPMYIHCSEGKDRTGCLAYLVEALMGEDEDTLYRDYLFSNLANSSSSEVESSLIRSSEDSSSLETFSSLEDFSSDFSFKFSLAIPSPWVLTDWFN